MTHTAGAIRAAERIGILIKTYHPDALIKEKPFIVQIIDRETHAAEMLEALEFIASYEREDGTKYDVHDTLGCINTAKKALKKARGKSCK